MGYEWDEECDPSVVDRWMYRGDTLLFQVQVYQPPPASSAPQNLTGWFLACMVKKQFADTDALAVAVSKTTGVAPNIITFPFGAAAGIIQVSIGPLNTITLGDGITRLVYDIQCIDPSGNVTTVERGRLNVRPDVTRATAPF
jgi:hypothetical protein